MSNNSNIWVVDDEHSIRWVLEKALTQNGWTVECFESAEQLLDQLQISTPQVVITDIRMPGTDGLELLRALKVSHSGLPVIVMTAHSDLDSAVTSIQGGAFEYLPKPFDVRRSCCRCGVALLRRHNKNDKSHAPKEDRLKSLAKLRRCRKSFGP